ncbi:MAG: DUF2256 and DUF3253 domain-containing protein [Myxococcaceae bacterium]|nr:DUF2256 and DUF3253 domain-containing protein [Myxococcaceae bacterium]
MKGAWKTCAVCGRVIEWRKRWARSWEQVRYCSDACRRRRNTALGVWEARVLELVEARPVDASVCPSEVARQFAPPGHDWREAMQPVREAARRLVAQGRLAILQGGHEVDPSTARGPIRLARRRAR